jgi:hypothetical protein
MGNESMGCLAFLFGFSGGARPNTGPAVNPRAGEEGNYHSGPGGYEGMGYADGGYSADYRADQGSFNEDHESEA